MDDASTGEPQNSTIVLHWLKSMKQGISTCDRCCSEINSFHIQFIDNYIASGNIFSKVFVCAERDRAEAEASANDVQDKPNGEQMQPPALDHPIVPLHASDPDEELSGSSNKTTRNINKNKIEEAYVCDTVAEDRSPYQPPHSSIASQQTSNNILHL